MPTAASIIHTRRAGLIPIASGGLRDGHDAARAIALGARLASMALPFLRAVQAGGPEAALAFYGRALDGLKTAMILSGARTPAALALAPRRLGPNLRLWIDP